MRGYLTAAIGTLLFFSCKDNPRDTTPHNSVYRDTAIISYGPYVALKLPLSKGTPIANPIQITLGPDSLIYAANQTGEVYTLHDTDNDGLEDSTAVYCNIRDFGLRSPAGLAFRGDTLYIGTSQQIRAFTDMNNDGKSDSTWVVWDKIPESGHPYEWTSGLTLGPDDWFYFALATDSWNAAPSPDSLGYRGAILRISPDGKAVERIATGVRSVYGIDFNEEGDLFFTDNEGGGNPGEELNLLVKNGFYGHNPAKYPHDSVLDPALTLQTEVAPSGIQFNSMSNDFGGSAGNLFVAYYGPGERWNRGAIAKVKVDRDEAGRYRFTEIPVADFPKVSDITFGKDGSLYVAQHGMADYWYNSVYKNQGAFFKLVYDPEYKDYPPERKTPAANFTVSNLETGKQLFAEAACLGCHQVDGETELLGPNLKDIGKQLTREEILEDITMPSVRIKPSMMGQQITRKNGQVLLGRLVSSNEEELSIMLVGNSVVHVPRGDISEVRDVNESLMYEGLLTGMTDDETNALLDYLISLSKI